MKTLKQFVAGLAILTACGMASAQTSSSNGGPVNSSSGPVNQPSAPPTRMSEPGTLPLIALGVVGAVAVGRFLKRRKNNKR